MVIVSGVLISFFTIVSMSSQIELFNNLTYEKEQLQQQVTSLENDIKSLNHELELVNTDEYMEKVVREKLGYIKPNEFIFREKD